MTHPVDAALACPDMRVLTLFRDGRGLFGAVVTRLVRDEDGIVRESRTPLQTGRTLAEALTRAMGEAHLAAPADDLNDLL